MPRDTEDPQVLRASDTVDNGGPDGSVVREIRPVAASVPVDQGAAGMNADEAPDTGTILVNRQRTLRSRYGGMYWGSDFLGFAVAVFFMIVFLGIVGAIVGAVGFQLHAPVPKIGGSISGQTQNLGIGALVGSLIAVFLAYLLGGYAAGRMGRFAGALNGLGVWIWTIVVAVLLAIAGAIFGNAFNVASQIHLNVSRTTLTTAGAISIGVTLLVMLIGAVLGGMMGERFHRRIDSDTQV